MESEVLSFGKMNLNLSYNPFLFFEVIKALMYICRWSFGIVLWEIATYGKCSLIIRAT